MIVGVDIGVTGAIVRLSAQTPIISLMPTIDNPKSKSGKLLDVPRLIDIFKALDPVECKVFIEHPLTMPGMNCVAVFNFAEQYGIIKGIISTLGLSYVEVYPVTWKRYWKVQTKGTVKTREKKAISILKVQQLVGLDFSRYPKTYHSGIADAILIALYGKEQAGRKPSTPEISHLEK